MTTLFYYIIIIIIIIINNLLTVTYNIYSTYYTLHYTTMQNTAYKL